MFERQNEILRRDNCILTNFCLVFHLTVLVEKKWKNTKDPVNDLTIKQIYSTFDWAGNKIDILDWDDIWLRVGICPGNLQRNFPCEGKKAACISVWMCSGYAVSNYPYWHVSYCPDKMMPYSKAKIYKFDTTATNNNHQICTSIKYDPHLTTEGQYFWGWGRRVRQQTVWHCSSYITWTSSLPKGPGKCAEWKFSGGGGGDGCHLEKVHHGGQGIKFYCIFLDLIIIDLLEGGSLFL